MDTTFVVEWVFLCLIRDLPPIIGLEWAELDDISTTLADVGPILALIGGCEVEYEHILVHCRWMWCRKTIPKI